LEKGFQNKRKGLACMTSKILGAHLEKDPIRRERADNYQLTYVPRAASSATARKCGFAARNESSLQHSYRTRLAYPRRWRST
jgi:hypothetical protein